MKKILLNWLPPANLQMPSPSMSVLKKYLSSHGFKVDVCYWNLKLKDIQSEFIWTKEFSNDDLISLYIFYNYLAFNKGDKTVLEHLKIYLKLLKPQYVNAGYDFFDNHMKEYSEKFDLFVEKTLNEAHLEQYLYCGLSMNLYQWVGSSIIAEKIKKICPSIPIITGGIGTKESAIAFLDNFPQFDLAIWGEGEAPLLAVSKELESNPVDPDFTGIANMVYRKDGELIISTQPNRNYIDLSSLEIRPDFSDYFIQKQETGICVDTYMPIENSRSCHWKKCHFCYLNNGYKYRVKSVESVVEEIRFMIEKYEIYSFGFLDNDIIGIDIDRFNTLLDCLIDLKIDYPDFNVVIAEIITKDIHDSDIIKKMALAGFKHCQIGYESPSDELLKEINKKNSFASNLLFIKYARQYNIHIGGANVLRNLLEERDEHIFEAINNLYFLRFNLESQYFEHNISKLGVIHSSRYYKEIESQLDIWDENLMKTLLPGGFVKKENRIKIIEVFKSSTNHLWNLFKELEAYYLKNFYEYKLFQNGENIIYREYCNSEMINDLEFEVSGKHFVVLKGCNNRVLSFQELYQLCNTELGNGFSEADLTNTLSDLKREGLVFSSKDNLETISIINVNLLN